MSATALGPGALVGGDFRIVRLLASGGMGAVYVAEQRSTGSMRAVKVLHARFAGDLRTRERFVDEAKASVRIQSDHVVEVVAAGVDEATGLPWLAMELLEGTTLGDAIEQRGALPRDEAWEVFRQLGHALTAAHAAGVVHRDLKPENVFLATSRRHGVPFTVKVLDFGIAKLLVGRAASNTQALGSPRWMAPEQLAPGATIDASTDVWSLGLLAYYTLTGTHYWRRAESAESNAMAIVVEIASEPLVPASERAAARGRADRIPPGFDLWFSRCVARAPAERFPHAGEATAALLATLQAPRLAQTVATPAQPMAYAPPTAATPYVPAPMTPSRAPSAPWIPAPPSQPRVPWGMAPVEAPPTPPPSQRGRGVGLAVGGALAAVGLALAGLGIGVSLRGETSTESSQPRPPPPPTPPATVDAAAPPFVVETNVTPFAAGQRWVGSYVCAQGSTELTLRIVSVAGDYLNARFEFAYGPRGVRGIFEMHGGFQRGARRLPLQPGAWIERPRDYQTVAMDGTVSFDGSTYAGRILDPACGAFSLTLAR